MGNRTGDRDKLNWEVDPAEPQPNWGGFAHRDCFMLTELARSLYSAWDQSPGVVASGRHDPKSPSVMSVVDGVLLTSTMKVAQPNF